MQLIKGIQERNIIERLRSGDRTAFELLFQFYYPGLVIYATQFAVDELQAEDIVQNMFIKLWEKRQRVKLVDSLKSYFFTSVRNSCLNSLKHQQVKSKYIGQLYDMSEKNLLYQPNLYIASELQEIIRQAIDELPERCREVFVMSRLEQMKNDEIAEKLNLSKRTVETHISHALKILRVKLKDYLPLLILLGFRL
ncbi:RNA polymerase sigma-70 factor [Prolixibacter sp. SD074]|uniref:RNA polymerase sigma-70 factor n=1 Tax=Prolixibacter sp. SD074 TaxID=2652391 RepID=UPI00127C1C06|nr:RNA polymerase sigma-70 factor [Prolixibacter sp. SD074]GET29864.1 DNA-directed RNA polymerase sigma-70 factor [Prolixibacter sp. SD074]